VKKLIVAVVMCLMATSTDAAFGQSARVGWDGTWVGGWEKGTGVQLIFAGETLIEATLTRTPHGGMLLVIHEHGEPEVSIPLKRDGR
jgi:hypothetical protein